MTPGIREIETTTETIQRALYRPPKPYRNRKRGVVWICLRAGHPTEPPGYAACHILFPNLVWHAESAHPSARVSPIAPVCYCCEVLYQIPLGGLAGGDRDLRKTPQSVSYFIPELSGIPLILSAVLNENICSVFFDWWMSCRRFKWWNFRNTPNCPNEKYTDISTQPFWNQTCVNTLDSKTSSLWKMQR